MQKVGKSFLITLGVVLGLAAVGILILNLYVQSAGTQARIQRELSAALRLPVRMSGTTLTPWGGLKVTGVAVPQTDPAHAGNFFEAPSFAAFFEWAPLLRHRVVLSRITLNEPKVAWFQDGSGKWLLPGPPEKAAPPAQPPAEEPRAARREKAPPYEVTLGQLRIRHGAFVFLDARGGRVAAFSDVQADCPGISSRGEAEGTASIAKAALRDMLFFENVRTPFSYADGVLRLRGLEAALGGGALHGDLEVRTAEKRSPFSTSTRFDGVNLDTLVAAAGNVPGRATGTLAGWLELSGESGRTDTLRGSGQITLAGGRLQHEFFQLLGQALQIDELAMLNLKSAQLDLHVADGSVWIDLLSLQSANLQLLAHGTARLPNGKLQLDARLTVNGRLARQLPGFVEANFQPAAEPDQRFIDFTVGGTAAKPQTNLMERILGRKIEREMGSLFQNIFKPKRKKTKPAAADALPPTPGASATAAPGTTE